MSKNKTEDKYRFQWQTANLDSILNHYANGFDMRKGEKLISNEHYIDIAKGEVVFKLFLGKTNGD